MLKFETLNGRVLKLDEEDVKVLLCTPKYIVIRSDTVTIMTPTETNIYKLRMETDVTISFIKQKYNLYVLHLETCDGISVEDIFDTTFEQALELRATSEDPTPLA